MEAEPAVEIMFQDELAVTHKYLLHLLLKLQLMVLMAKQVLGLEEVLEE